LFVELTLAETCLLCAHFSYNPLSFLGLHQGFVISDFEGIDRITSPHRANITYSIEAGVSAGIDMVVSLGQKYMI